MIRRLFCFIPRACVLVIGDFNVHSHISVNDCQLNMNDDVFLLSYDERKEGKRETEKEKEKKNVERKSKLIM